MVYKTITLSLYRVVQKNGTKLTAP